MTFTGFSGSNLPALVDHFNRADSPNLGGSWQEGADHGGSLLAITSNQVGCPSGGFHVAYYAGLSDNHLGFAFTMAVVTAGDYNICGTVLTPDGGNGVDNIEFYFVSGMDTIEIWYDDTTLEQSVALSETFVNGDQVGFDVEDTGSDIVYKFFRRAGAAGSWSQVGTHTDTAAGRGGPWQGGFGIIGAIAARFDDFYAETITAAAGAPVGQMMLTGVGS